MIETLVYFIALIAALALAVIAVNHIIAVIRSRGTVDDMLHGGHTDTDAMAPAPRLWHRVRLYALLAAPIGLLLILFAALTSRYQGAIWGIYLGAACAGGGMLVYLVASVIAGLTEGWQDTADLRKLWRDARSKR